MNKDEFTYVSNIEILFIVGIGLFLMNWLFGFLFLTGLVLQIEYAQKQAQSKTIKPSQVEHDAGHLMLISPALR